MSERGRSQTHEFHVTKRASRVNPRSKVSSKSMENGLKGRETPEKCEGERPTEIGGKAASERECAGWLA